MLKKYTITTWLNTTAHNCWLNMNRKESANTGGE